MEGLLYLGYRAKIGVVIAGADRSRDRPLGTHFAGLTIMMLIAGLVMSNILDVMLS